MKLNGAIFSNPITPTPLWLPFLLAAVVVVGIYIASGGGEEAIGPCALALSLSITFFGGLHYQVARAWALSGNSISTEEIPQENIYAEDTVWLNFGENHLIRIDLQRKQLTALKRLIKAGKRELLFRYLLEGGNFSQGDARKLRKTFLNKGLAYKHGKKVILRESTCRAIMRMAPSPTGLD